MTSENIAALQALVQTDPALAQQLKSATLTDSAVALLSSSHIDPPDADLSVPAIPQSSA